MEDQVVYNLLHSLAQEETAIANILVAESEKLNKIAKTCKIKDMLEVNESAICLIEAVNKLESIMKDELKLIKEYLM